MALRSFAPIGTLLGVTLIVVSGCGSIDDGGTSLETIPAGYPTIAPERFDGAFDLIEAAVGGQDLALAVQPALDIDVLTGAVRLDLGCNSHFGSYTIAEDSTASFTFTGGTGQTCDETATQREQTLLDLFETVESWETISDEANRSYAFTTESGDSFVIVSSSAG